MKKIIVAALLWLLATPATAQWQTPDHSVPIGRGPGVTGFRSVTIGDGQLLIGQSGGDPLPKTLSGSCTLTNLGVISCPVSASSITGTIAITQGGTGATTASGARTNLGLGTAATVDTGTSGAKVPLLNAANTWSGVQTVNLNSAAAPTPATGTGLHVVGANAAVSRIEAMAFGGSPGFTAARADGTGTTPTAVQNLDVVGFFGVIGYDGSAWSTSASASMFATATGNWSTSSHPARMEFWTTPPTSTTLTLRGYVDAGWVAGSPTGGDKGAGTVNAASGVYDNGTRINPGGIAKAWGFVTYSGGVPSLASSFGATSVSDDGTGLYTVTLSAAMASSNYAVLVRGDTSTTNSDGTHVIIASRTTTTFQVQVVSGGIGADFASSFVVFGN